MLDQVPVEQEDIKGLNDMRILFNKILDEKSYWALSTICREFTAGCNIHSRNEMLKMQLSKDVLFGQKYEQTPIEDALNYLLDFGWF